MCVILHTVGGLRYFVARQFLLQIYALLSVKFPGLKMCGCKKKDKYQVCTRIRQLNSIFSGVSTSQISSVNDWGGSRGKFLAQGVILQPPNNQITNTNLNRN